MSKPLGVAHGPQAVAQPSRAVSSVWGALGQHRGVWGALGQHTVCERVVLWLPQLGGHSFSSCFPRLRKLMVYWVHWVQW